MDNVVELRSERARLVARMDRLMDRVNDCNVRRVREELHELSRIVNRIDARLIGIQGDVDG